MASFVKEELSCSVCLDEFKSPRNLTCGHAFCTDCLQELKTPVRGATEFEIKCQDCRELTKHVDHVHDLTKNCKISKVIEILQEHDGLKGKMLCDVCGQAATDRCCQFLKSYCSK